MMALTATATPRVQKDILNQLNMSRPQVYVFTFSLWLRFKTCVCACVRVFLLLAGSKSKTVTEHFSSNVFSGLR